MRQFRRWEWMSRWYSVISDKKIPIATYWLDVRNVHISVQTAYRYEANLPLDKKEEEFDKVAEIVYHNIGHAKLRYNYILTKLI